MVYEKKSCWNNFFKSSISQYRPSANNLWDSRACICCNNSKKKLWFLLKFSYKVNLLKFQIITYIKTVKDREPLTRVSLTILIKQIHSCEYFKVDVYLLIWKFLAHFIRIRIFMGRKQSSWKLHSQSDNLTRTFGIFFHYLKYKFFRLQ